MRKNINKTDAPKNDDLKFKIYKIYHFIINKEHMLFRARNYDNAYKQVQRFVQHYQLLLPITYLGYSNGVFGEIKKPK